MTPTPRDVRFLTTASALRDWFDANHATASELWLGYHRKATGRSDLDWSAAVDEALCVGWIDGVRYRLDETTFAQRFTPRRKGSTWSAINVAKVDALTRDGRMRPAGLAAFAAPDPGEDGHLLVRAGLGDVHRGRDGGVAGRAGGLGGLGGSTAVVPEGCHALGDERQAAGDPRAAPGGTHRGLAAGQKVKPMRARRES